MTAGLGFSLRSSGRCSIRFLVPSDSNQLGFALPAGNDVEYFQAWARAPFPVVSSLFHFCGKVFSRSRILLGVSCTWRERGYLMNLRNLAFVVLVVVPIAEIPVLSQTPAPSSGTRSQIPTASPAPQRNDGADAIPAGTLIPAALSKSVDAKKAKPGDKIEARITMDLLSNGKIVIPRDTKVIGHVTEAKPRTKESPDSRVGLSFDRISLKDGRELSIRAAIQAMGPSLDNVVAPGVDQLGQRATGMPSAAAPDSRGPMGGSDRPGGSTGSPFPDASSRDASAGVAASERSAPTALDPHSHGVMGLRGLSLSPSNQGSLVDSNGHNVHLDSGTQLILRTE
jgi:hypothetical protein